MLKAKNRQVDLSKIESTLLTRSAFVKEAAVIIKEGSPFAVIYPDFELLKKEDVINIKEEIKWYGVELYNIDAQEDEKIRGYRVMTHPLAKTPEGEWDKRALLHQKTQEEEAEGAGSEPDDEIYRELKKYLSSVSAHPVHPSSHLELDLELDSLEYVMLFVFIEKSFGLHLDEKVFSKLMVMKDLYHWVYKYKTESNVAEVNWNDILTEKSSERLVYSPWIMMAWKIALLPFFKFYFHLKVSGRENFPEGPFIIAPNHYSMLDGFVVLASLPSPVLKKSFFLSYEGEFGTPRLKPLAKHSQMLLINIDKDLKNSLQRTALPLIESQNLVIFPENARSRDGKMLPFKKFFAILSKEINVPIVPAVLQGTFEALPAGKIFPKRTNVTVKYLKPVYPDDAGYEALRDRVKKAIQAELHMIQNCS
ncbi:MAG: 1-acyl-sn-glycerol-3-phosphate acyltransferase [Helicobacteraceae bacterium]|nr:1-acyl-sn-glycerol-3-phosphate acyltransferase [Helicobacteraceae bacterium]